MALSQAIGAVAVTAVGSVSTDRGDGLTRRAQRGDRDAFTALMAAHKDGLYRFVRRRVSDPDDAYDIVQEAFLAAWRAIGRFDPERPFGAWLRSIALNKCRDHARRRTVRRSLMAPCADGAAERLPDDAPSPEDEAIDRNELAALRRAVEALPRHLREALTLTAIDGMPQAAAAAALGCTVKAIEYRVHRAREIIAATLAGG